MKNTAAELRISDWSSDVCSSDLAQDAVDRAFAVLQQLLGREGGAVPADEDEAAGEAPLRRLGEVDDLRHVREVVAGEGDRLRPALSSAERRLGKECVSMCSSRWSLYN